MFKSIKNFFSSLNPDIIVQAPARINLINPLDAVEGDYWMPSAAITGKENPLSVFVYIKTIKTNSKIKIYESVKIDNELKMKIEQEETILKNISQIENKFTSELKLFYATIFRFYKTNSFFWEKFLEQNFEIGILTTIPRQSGLGGSAAIIIALIYAFSRYFNLYNNLSYLQDDEIPINKDIIAEMATKVEDIDLKITAGYADRYLISRGGLSFCSYQGKLYHKEISNEPLAVYDRIDQTYDIHELPIIICFSGVIHRSEGVHNKLRTSYLQNEQKILEHYKKLADISWKSRFALMKKDWKLLGEYFKENTRLMNEVMIDAGFKYGIGLANNILIKLIEEHSEVYAAKLTGAGGGGCVFALVNPEKINKVLEDWKRNLKEIIKNKEMFKNMFPSYPIEIRNELKNAKFYTININQTGVKILYMSVENE